MQLERPDEAWMTPVSTPIKPTAEQIKSGKKTDALYITTENNMLWQSDRDKATALQEYVKKIFKDKYYSAYKRGYLDQYIPISALKRLEHKFKDELTKRVRY